MGSRFKVCTPSYTIYQMRNNWFLILHHDESGRSVTQIDVIIIIAWEFIFVKIKNSVKYFIKDFCLNFSKIYIFVTFRYFFFI